MSNRRPRRRDACSPADREAEIRTEPHAAQVLALRDQTTVCLRGTPPPAKRKERQDEKPFRSGRPFHVQKKRPGLGVWECSLNSGSKGEKDYQKGLR